MRVIEPSRLIRDAADVLAPVAEEVVVIGAIAVEVALAGSRVGLTPTRDIDLAVETDEVDEIVRVLRDAGLEPSDEPHEAGFTWIRGDLKVQLIRGFHPFPKGAASGLPDNPAVQAAHRDAHRYSVAFSSEPERHRFWAVNPACLVALKQNAFGRSRPDGRLVERDYSDAYLLIREVPDAVVSSFAEADYQVRAGVRAAVEELALGGDATKYAAHQVVLAYGGGSQRDAELDVLRAAREFIALLERR